MTTRTDSATRARVTGPPAKASRQAAPVSSPGVGKPRIGLAFQGGSFLAGAIGAGVVAGLVEARAFEKYDICAFSGTSAGALVAAVCWRHALSSTGNSSAQDAMKNAPQTLREQWLHYANGSIPHQDVGDGLKLIDRLWSTNPIYFWWKDNVSVQSLHQLFLKWVDAYVEPETCMELLFDRYKLGSVNAAADPKQLLKEFNEDAALPRLMVGATSVKDSESVNITDQDLFAELLDAWKLHKDARHKDPRGAAIRAAADYMRQGIMASGSLDSINGMTTIDQGRHAGTYLDGAWAENPPLKGLLAAKIDQIWMVEVFPKRCAEIPNTFPQREDRREELWQNAVVEQQLAFIRKVNLWLESGRLVDGSKVALRKTLDDGPPADCQRLLAAFKDSEDDWEDRIADKDKIIEALLKPYKHVETRCIELPADLQPLTAGARLVNSRSFLLDKIELGRANVLRFLTTVKSRPN